VSTVDMFIRCGTAGPEAHSIYMEAEGLRGTCNVAS
jgi:hypothetical protein